MYGLIKEQQSSNNVTCSDSECSGTYVGPESDKVNGDVAHQFSNKMSNAVGDKLKELFKSGNYSKVDFKNIKMSTKEVDKNPGSVTYSVTIPFVKVNNECDAYTSFDHVGGWGHTPELSKRKLELSKLLMPNDTFDVSDIIVTPKVQEYWIQWRNRGLQLKCSGTPNTLSSTTQKKIKPITGTDYIEFKKNIKDQTKNLSIDWDSAELNLPSKKLKLNTGNDKLVNLSLIWDNISEDNLLDRYKVLKRQNEEDGYTVKEKEVIYQDGFWFLLIAILK